MISQTYPNILCAAFALADPEWGQAIHLAIVGSDKSDEAGIQEILSREIGVASKIKAFHYLEELPLKGIGKIDRAELGRLFSE